MGRIVCKMYFVALPTWWISSSQWIQEVLNRPLNREKNTWSSIKLVHHVRTNPVGWIYINPRHITRRYHRIYRLKIEEMSQSMALLSQTIRRLFAYEIGYNMYIYIYIYIHVGVCVCIHTLFKYVYTCVCIYIYT